MFVELPAGHFSARANDGVALGRIRGPGAQPLIGERTRPFHRAEGAYQGAMHGPPGQREILQRP